MNQERRRFLVASPGLASAAGNVARIMAAATLQRQVLASPHFFPALS